MKSDFVQRVDTCYESVKQLSRKPCHKLRAGIILGSGLQDYGDRFDGLEIEYSSITSFPQSTVKGHRGSLKLGDQVAVFMGRFHFYEGYSFDDVILPVFLMNKLGVEYLIVTNAAGAVNSTYQPADLILIKDQINLMGANPLIGPHMEDLGPRFPDMTDAYSADLRSRIMARVKAKSGQKLKEGIYAAMPGPSYETPAEINMLRTIGADMVGMSTVPEVISAVFLGLRVVGISCITNMAAGVLDQPLNHQEVLEIGQRAKGDMGDLLDSIIQLLLEIH